MFPQRYHVFPHMLTWSYTCGNVCFRQLNLTETWYGSAVTAATETRVNVTKPTAETRVNRHVSATVSHISSTFPFTDSWYFVLCCGPPSLKIRRTIIKIIDFGCEYACGVYQLKEGWFETIFIFFITCATLSASETLHTLYYNLKC